MSWSLHTFSRGKDHRASEGRCTPGSQTMSLGQHVTARGGRSGTAARTPEGRGRVLERPGQPCVSGPKREPHLVPWEYMNKSLLRAGCDFDSHVGGCTDVMPADGVRQRRPGLPHTARDPAVLTRPQAEQQLTSPVVTRCVTVSCGPRCCSKGTCAL